jgi:hypothetical protein
VTGTVADLVLNDPNSDPVNYSSLDRTYSASLTAETFRSRRVPYWRESARRRGWRGHGAAAGKESFKDRVSLTPAGGASRGKPSLTSGRENWRNHRENKADSQFPLSP